MATKNTANDTFAHEGPEAPEVETWDPAADAQDSDSSTAVEVASDSGVKAEIRELMTGAPAMYSSIKGDSFADRKATLSAVKNSSPIAESIGKVINVKNIIVQAITMKNDYTGNLENQPRVILIDENGTAHHAISKVLFSDVKDIIGLVKEPHTWPEPLPVIVTRHKATRGHFFSLSIVD